MTKLIDNYLNAHQLAWAPTTLKSERSRLLAVSSIIASGPRAMYEAKSAELKPYALKTLFIRLTDLERWANRSWGYGAFMQENARLFKHVYTKELTNHGSISQISALLSQIPNDHLRTLAFGLLRNGMRISELTSYDKRTGLVVGKNRRRRHLLSPSSLPDQHCSARDLTALRRELRKLGLKPHTLRKAAASALAREGRLSAEDLMRAMGWSNIQTAASYLQPLNDEKISAVANSVLGG